MRSPAPRRPHGYRDYGGDALAILLFIKRAQALGFPLRDIADHLRSPHDDGRKARLQARLEGKLAELDHHIEQVHARRAVILSLVEEVRAAREAR